MSKQANFWIYANSSEQYKVSASLIVFGAETFKRAKIIQDINQLKYICSSLDNNKMSPQNTIINDFIFEYLIDCIKILIFFENYMKAELITGGFCVHKIKKDFEEYKDLSKKQYREPITLKEIHSIEPFVINESTKTIFHKAISETTLGFKELVSSKNYISYYEFDTSILDFLKEINSYRNRLHFNESIDFKLSMTLIDNLENLNHFVDKMLQNRITFLV